ncbi:MAG: response regulator [Gemmatimonadota bacterium]|nr:response regulator [Gemmatimonadota bacterium]
MTETVTGAAVRTLIVDDEPLARLRLRTLLAEHADFSVIGECGDGREALDVIAREHPDLVFLDVQMAETNGIEVARLLEDGDDAPVIVFVTAYDQYAVRAFELRALDYLLKPFDEDRFSETLERIRVQRSTTQTRDAHARLLTLLRDLSRGDVPSPAGPDGSRPRGANLQVADLEVDVRARQVRRAGRNITLRPKEFDLLLAILKRAGDVVPRRELLHEVWGYSDDVVSRTIDTHLAELRRKLGHSAGERGYIATVARSGYRMEV